MTMVGGYGERKHSAARFPHTIAWVQPTDPFATVPDLIHPGVAWIDTSGGSPPWPMFVRNVANTAWEAIGGVGGGTGAGHQVQINGVDLPQRATLNFVGDGVYGYDDAANDATVIGFIVGDVPANVVMFDGRPLIYNGQYVVWEP